MRKTEMNIREHEGVMILTVEGLDNYLTACAESYDAKRDERRKDEFATAQWRMGAIAIREIRDVIRKRTGEIEAKAHPNGIRQDGPTRPQDAPVDEDLPESK